MKNIDSDLIRGNIDTIILTTMLDGDKYGLDIIKDVETKSNGTYELKQPTLYSCLKRLENQELISSYWLDSDIGGRRHYYKLTEKGRDSLLKKQEEWAKSKFIIDNLLSNHDYDEYRLVKKEDYDKIIEGKQFEYTPSNQSAPLSNKQEAENFEENVEDAIDQDAETNDTEKQDDLDDILEYESLVDDDNDETDELTDEDFSVQENTTEKRFDYSDDSDEIENDYPNQKRFKIPSIYDSINISDADIDEESEDDDDEVNSIYSNSELEQDSDFDDIDSEEIDEILNLDEPDEEFMLGDNDSENAEEDEENRVYVSDYNSYDEDENDDEDLDIQIEPISDQSENELNILSKLRMQDDDKVNEYIGDKNSYVNHLNKTQEIENLKRDDLNVVQEDLLSNNNYLSQSSVDNKINEFSSAIEELNNFGTESNNVEEDNFMLQLDSDNNSFETENFDSETEIEDEIISNNSLQQESEDIIEFKKAPEHKDDYLDDLEELKTLNNQGFFNSDDSADYEPAEDNIEHIQVSNHFDSLDDFLQTEEHDAEFEKQVQEYNSQFGYDESSYNNQTQTFDYQESNYNSSPVEPVNFSTFDDIISKNVDSYTSDTNRLVTNEEYHTFTPSYTENNYKQKLNNLSAYSKTNNDNPTAKTTANEQNEEVMSKVKDIQSLRAEFADEGICVKEFKRSSGHADVDRNYLLINKMNLIKSLILFFGYVFVLSAVYVIMNNTSAQTIHNFSFKYFLYGFIPFGIYALYHIIMFVINPYKKIPAKFAPRIMIFIAIIITIQLLLITYCVNLQLGFYSFSQNLYNHLLWVIPTIISFAPIITTLIHIALYYSKNFNV